jgi:cobalamin transport system substrate-binding protein
MLRLFARESRATGLATFARLFCWSESLQRAARIAAGGALAGAMALSAGTMQAGAMRDASAQDASAKRVVTDELGRRVEVAREVRRIVTLAPNLTETIYALGLEAQLAGDTDYCDTPAAAKSKPHVGAPLNPSLEAIVALHPDLVLATTSINRRETVEALSRLGIPAYTTDPHTVRGMLESIEHIAEIAGASEPQMDIVARLQHRLDALHARLEERPLVHVLFVVWEEPLISIGQNTFIADALRWAGAESVILSDKSWPQIGMEEVVRLQPDYIVLASNHSESGAKTELEDLRARPAWKQLAAVRMGHVAMVSEEVTRPSPGLVDTIEDLAHQLHPEAFDGKTENGKVKMENGAARGEVAMARGCDGCGR